MLLCPVGAAVLLKHVVGQTWRYLVTAGSRGMLVFAPNLRTSGRAS